MTAFTQLGYGYKSNTSHIAAKSEPSEISLAWWRNCLTEKQKVDLIVKKHPECLTQSFLRRLSLWKIYNENPQKLYDDWMGENKIKKTFTQWLMSDKSK